MLDLVGSPRGGSNRQGWRKRLTYVTTSGRNTTGTFVSLGTVIRAELLVGARVRCPRCDSPAATLWRRFDYFKGELPLYFTKCRRCLRRRSINADEAAFRLVEAGVADHMGLLHKGLPKSVDGTGTDDGERDDHDRSGLSISDAKQLVENRQRAYGKKHELTFAARAQLAESFGNQGDPADAVRVYEQLVTDQRAAVGHQTPAVLANQFRTAVWTAHVGDPWKALTELGALLPDQERILGKDHVNTLITRTTIAQLTDQTGDREQAIAMLRELSRDQIRLLGSEHPVTEATRRLLADWDR